MSKILGFFGNHNSDKNNPPDSEANYLSGSSDRAKEFYHLSEHFYDQISIPKKDRKFTREEIDVQLSKLFARTENDPKRMLSLFNTLTEREFKKVCLLFFHRQFSAGEYLFREGNPGSALFYIMKGAVSIQRVVPDSETGIKKEVIITTLEAGDLFGEMSLLDDSLRSTDAVCSQDTEILMLFRSELLDLFKRYPVIGWKIMTNLAWIMSERLKRTNNDLVILKNENKKLQQELEEKAAE